MHRVLRYGITSVVGLAITGLVARFTTGDLAVTVSLFPVYALATSLLIAHRGAWSEMSRKAPDARSRLRGAAGGGAGAFAGSALLIESVPSGVAALGLFLLGFALAVADFDRVL